MHAGKWHLGLGGGHAQKHQLHVPFLHGFLCRLIFIFIYFFLFFLRGSSSEKYAWVREARFVCLCRLLLFTVKPVTCDLHTVVCILIKYKGDQSHQLYFDLQWPFPLTGQEDANACQQNSSYTRVKFSLACMWSVDCMILSHSYFSFCSGERCCSQ